MIYLLPIFISLIFYILKEFNGFIMLGIIYFLSILLYTSSINISTNTIESSGIITLELLVLILLSILIIYWLNINFSFCKGTEHDNTYQLLGAIFIIGAYLTLTSTSIISLFISIELLSFTMIIIINLYIQDKYPGILYYLFSGLISGLFILSIGFIWMGSTISYKLLSIVIYAKLGIVPFHILLPIIYQNLSIQWIFIIDIPYKIVLFMVLYKLNLFIIDQTPIIILTLIIGAIGSLRYLNILSIQVYSSLYHYGLILITLSNNNLDYFVYYIFIYSFIVIILFYLITSYWINKSINQPYYLILWFILIMNLIGIPPLAGFFIKYNPLYLTLLNHNYILFLVSVFGLLILTYTYLRLLITMIISSNKLLILNSSQNYSHFISSLLVILSLSSLIL